MRLVTVAVRVILSCALVASCAPVRYVLPGAGPADDVRNDAECTYAALTTPPPYQSALPWHGYYGHRASAAEGMLVVLLLDRIATGAWQGRVRDECLLAMGYREVK